MAEDGNFEDSYRPSSKPGATDPLPSNAKVSNNGFGSLATTPEAYANDLFEYTRTAWSGAGFLQPVGLQDLGTPTPTDAVAVNAPAPASDVTELANRPTDKPVNPYLPVTDAASYLVNLQRLRKQHVAITGGYGNDSTVTPAGQAYSDRRYATIAPREGPVLRAEDDGKGYMTVGVGYNMDRSGGRDTFKRVLGVDDKFFDDVRNRNVQITPEQSKKLFASDMNDAEAIIQKKFGHLALPESKRIALVSMAFNSPSLIGPKLTAAVLAGDDHAALQEILYNSNRENWRGLARRRHDEARQFVGDSNAADQLIPDFKSYIARYPNGAGITALPGNYRSNVVKTDAPAKKIIADNVTSSPTG